jgi:ABC-type proline/glycine betaine transport system permease subunit
MMRVIRAIDQFLRTIPLIAVMALVLSLIALWKSSHPPVAHIGCANMIAVLTAPDTYTSICADR